MEPRGKTTEQMIRAKTGAVFVWPNYNIDYPKALARYLGRTDLKIVSPIWLNMPILGAYSDVVIDHACVLTTMQEKHVNHYALYRAEKLKRMTVKK